MRSIVFWFVILMLILLFSAGSTKPVKADDDRLLYRIMMAEESQARSLQEISETLKEISRKK